MSIDNCTHNNDNECKKEDAIKKIQEDVFITNYTGDLVITTKDNYTKLCANSEKLQKQIASAKNVIMTKDCELKQLHEKAFLLQQENNEKNKLLIDYKREIERLQTQLNKFTINQQGRKSKLNEKTKAIIQRGLAQNMSITEIYAMLLANGFTEASYETVRRYCANVKKIF